MVVECPLLTDGEEPPVRKENLAAATGPGAAIPKRSLKPDDFFKDKGREKVMTAKT